jgi:hypothetical protein
MRPTFLNQVEQPSVAVFSRLARRPALEPLNPEPLNPVASSKNISENNS